MINRMDADKTVLAILGHYPTLSPSDAAAFLHVCAEEGLSLKALSKRLGYGQSITTRHVTALEEAGLVERFSTHDGLRWTVRLSVIGMALKTRLKT